MSVVTRVHVSLLQALLVAMPIMFQVRALADLLKLTGLRPVKSQFVALYHRIELDKERDMDFKKQNFNTIFYGNPGRLFIQLYEPVDIYPLRYINWHALSVFDDIFQNPNMIRCSRFEVFKLFPSKYIFIRCTY